VIVDVTLLLQQSDVIVEGIRGLLKQKHQLV
jgi:hypothetical protein